jgi:hypothetical protein
VAARLLLAAAFFLFALPAAGQQSGKLYDYQGSIPVPFAPTYLASDASGRLFVGSGNYTLGAAEAAAYVVAEPARNFSPVKVDSFLFPPGAGYSGVATDYAGNVYLCADTGEKETSFIKKLRPNLTPDPGFGLNGVKSGMALRPLGCATHGDRLLVALAWGYVQVFDSSTGNYQYLMPGNSSNKLRDIAVDPNAQLLFAGGQGGLFWWSGGSFAAHDRYQLATVRPTANEGSAMCEGIAYHPWLGVFQATASPPQALMVNAQGEYAQMSKLDNPFLGSVGDIAFSPDFQVMYVSDPLRKAIHFAVYSQAVDPPAPRGGLVGLPMEPASLDEELPTFASRRASQKEWFTSLNDFAMAATDQRRLMAFYFRDEKVALCAELESGVLAPKQLFDKHSQAIWMQVEIDSELGKELASRFGVFRVPAIVFLSEEGKKLGQLIGSEIADDSIARAVAPRR